MIRVLFYFIGVGVLFSACNLWQKEETDFTEAIKGDWLILYPDHDLDNDDQRKIYGTAQDSIVALLGLKTISFRDKGIFLQTDSMFKPLGKWNLNRDSRKLFIRNGGKGLDFFEGTLTGIKNDTMLIIENILIGGQKIKLTWFLKRITNKENLALFKEENNWWRKNAGAETDDQLRKRVKAMLIYYSLYYEMVSNESAYFSQSRVFLPFKYYQHSMGLRPFNDKNNFNAFFYTGQQARQAHAILATAMDKIRYKSFPSGKDFVIEYSLFMQQLSKVIGD
jgi:hypothetical protein